MLDVAWVSSRGSVSLNLPPPECGDIGGEVLLEIDKRNLDGLLELVSEDLQQQHIKAD